MYFADTRISASIAEKLSQLSKFVTVSNGMGYYDINVGAENFFCQLLNLGYGLDLINLNQIKPNYPAIDLGDKAQRVCFQITSTNTSTKLNHTLDQFTKYGLDADYNHLIFLVISDKPLPALKTLPGVTVEVWDVAKLAATIVTGADLQKLTKINDFLVSNLKSSSSTLPSFLPSLIASPAFQGSFDALLKDMGFENDDPDAAEISNAVKKLHEIISDLAPEERGFLYYILEIGADPAPGSGFPGDRTFAPIATVDRRVGGAQEAYNLYQSIHPFGLVDVENEYQPGYDGPYIPVYTARFYGGVDVNILTAIRYFCKKDRSLLRRIIVDADFSALC
jgi:hypothetical protein